MSTNARTSQERTAVRPTYVPLGTDADSCHHVYRTSDETIHVVHPERGRDRVEDVADRSIDTWMEFVATRRGWCQREYGVDLIELAARTLDA